MAERSLEIPRILLIPKEEPTVKKVAMTKLNLRLPADEPKIKEPLHLIIDTGGHKQHGKNLYQRQLKLLRRTLR
jgi:hypothetical protein